MPRTLLGRLGIKIMSINPENIFRSRSIFGREEKTPKPKGVEPSEDDDLLLPEQTEESKEIEEKALTKEAQEKYAVELKEITKLAKETGFKAVSIVALGEEGGLRFKNPDILFFPKNHLNNFREALKFIKKEDLYQGMRVEFSELKKCFEPPKLKIYRELDTGRDKLRKLEEKVETDEKKLLGKANDLVIGQKNIDKMGKKLSEHPMAKFSESEIKEQALKFAIVNILYAGIENSTAVKIARLKELWDKKKILPADYQEQFLEIVSPTLRSIPGMLPNLDKENIQNLEEEWFKTAEETGEKYLKDEEKEKKYDFGIYR